MTHKTKPVLYSQKDFSDVLRHIQQSRQKIFAQINTALIDLYWQIGEIISHKVRAEVWGKGVVTDLAEFIAQQDPELKGFSGKNLWRMKQFFETYQADAKLSPLVRELPWTHNTIIFSRCKSAEEREYYLNLCIKERYSKRELERQINTSHFERTILSNQKLSAVLRELHPTISSTLKDNYVLEFLGLLCRDKDEEVVEYALSRNLSPTLVAQYELLLPDKKLIRAKLHELSENGYWESNT